MNVPAAFRRRAVVEAESPVDVLSELETKRDAMATRAAAVRQRAADLDAAETASRAALEAAATAGEDTERHAETLAQLAARRVAIGHERTAVEAAFGTAKAAVEAEEVRLRDAETDAEISRLRAAEDRATEEYAGRLIATGEAWERLREAEDRLGSALANARRPYGRGFMTPARVAWGQAEEAAKARLNRARADGTCGPSSHLEETPIPHAGFSRF